MESTPQSVLNVKYRWYQTDVKVTVEIPIKNVVEENLKISFASQTLSTSIKLPDVEEYRLNVNLQHSIIPDKCSYKIRPTKVEIFLIKENHERWTDFEKTEKKSEIRSQNKSKNWDKLVNENLKDDEEQSVDTVFTKIYADCNDDQKRAMMKSFTESGGTVLSTNWQDVSQKKVEMKPPDGVEFKPWN